MVRPLPRCSLVVLLLCASALGCAERTAVTAPLRTAAGDQGIRDLMIDVARREACAQLQGKFVGLPADGPALAGPEQGLAPATGRWMIRQCQQDVADGMLSLKLGGLGWQWVDDWQGGSGVQQYVYFSAAVELRGTLDVAYDPGARLASIWLTPVGEVGARVEARGTISVQSKTLGAELLVALLPLLGQSADDMARVRVATEGAALFRRRLEQGGTLTFSTNNGQMDFVLAPLPNGVAPLRPFPVGPEPWQVAGVGFPAAPLSRSGPLIDLPARRCPRGFDAGFRSLATRALRVFQNAIASVRCCVWN